MIDVANDPGTMLRLAVFDEDIEIVETILNDGVDPNASIYRITPLGIAIAAGNLEIAKVLIEHGADVDYRGSLGVTHLISAAHMGEFDLVRLLVENGALVNAKADHGYTALHWAVMNPDMEMAAYLLEHGADVDAQIEFGSTPLTQFTCDQTPAVVQMLIDHGADVNQQTGIGGKTPMHEAVTNIAVMQVLLNNVANVNGRDDSGETPLHHAVETTRGGKQPDNPDDPAEVIRFLIKNGADIEARDDRGVTPLLKCFHTADASMAELLVSLGADINARDNDGGTIAHCISACEDPLFNRIVESGLNLDAENNSGYKAIHLATIQGGEQVVDTLINAGAQTDLAVAAGLGEMDAVREYTSQAGYIANHPELASLAITLASNNGHARIVHHLIQAGTKPKLIDVARIGDVETMRTLIESGADVNETSNRNYSALHAAASNGHNAAVELLVANGADVDLKGYWQRTPLEPAIRNRHVDTVRLLLELGADPNETYNFGGTSLHWAAWRDNKEIIQLLIEHGADVNALNENGATPLIQAARNIKSQPEIITLLIDSGADLNTQDEHGDTALHSAAGRFNSPTTEPLRLLLEAGADTEIVNNLGFSPLMSAGLFGDLQSVEMLLEHGANPNYTSEDGLSAMLYAITMENDELAELLRNFGAIDPPQELLLIGTFNR